MNIIARLEYELAYYDSAVHRFNHYTTRTPQIVWKGDRLGIVQETMLTNNICSKPESVMENETRKILWDFVIQTDLPTPTGSADLVLSNKMKRTWSQVDFAILTDLRLKVKGNVKINKYLDFTRKLRKLWNMKVTMIPIVAGIFGTALKGLESRLAMAGGGELEIRRKIKTIQKIALKNQLEY